MLLGVAGALVLALAGSTAANPTSARLGRSLLQTRGIWTEFDDPSAPNGWYSGELLHNGNFDPARPQVVAQLNAMRAMGVNEIAYELRSADPVWIPGDRTPPECNVSPDTGLQFPEPTREELTNLGRLFDLVASRGMKIALLLDNTHMDDRASSQRWLSTILGVVKGKPALDYIAFGGDTHLIDLNGDGVAEACGGQSEAPLWLGESSVAARYVQWAIGYGVSLGFPARQLTAESIVGFYPMEVQADAGPDAQDNHLWSPIAVMRMIFDHSGVPTEQRTYSISFYAHRKCAGFTSLPCTDEPAQGWAEETARYVRNITGSVARVTATEFGDQAPVETVWPTAKAIEDIGVLMMQYGIDGGTFWHWEDVTGDAPSSLADPVKRRGSFSYYPVQRELADLYGLHLTDVPNGSFENGSAGWKIAGRAETRPLDENAPWRGSSFLRLTGKATSSRIRVSPSTRYTTTAHLRVTAPATVTFRYSTCKNKPSQRRKLDTFHPAGPQPSFQTFPLSYTTPADACWVRIEVSSSTAIDVDGLR
jgi:hypothetical protein